MKIEDFIIEAWESRPPERFDEKVISISKEAYDALLCEHAARSIQKFGIASCMKFINKYELRLCSLIKCDDASKAVARETGSSVLKKITKKELSEFIKSL